MPRRTTPDPYALVIGTRIRRLREESGLGLEDLAHLAEFSKGHLSSLERGYVMPTIATLRVLAEALGVLVADMVIDPDGTDREQVLELTRYAPKGTLRRLVRDLHELPVSRAKAIPKPKQRASQVATALGDGKPKTS